MREEIVAAASWWTSQLSKKTTDAKILESFKDSMIRELTQHFTGHWYEDSPLRGSAHRSISFDHRLDNLIEKAAKGAGIEPAEKIFAHTRNRIMWINPGEVKIQRMDLGSDAPFKYVLRKTSQLLKRLVSGSSSSSSSTSPSFPIPSPSPAPAVGGRVKGIPSGSTTLPPSSDASSSSSSSTSFTMTTAATIALHQQQQQQQRGRVAPIVY